MRTVRRNSAVILITLVVAGPLGYWAIASLVPTTRVDFFEPGTQPNVINDIIIPSQACSFCHGFFNVPTPPYDRWVTSLMAQAGRDAIFQAGLAIANQDAAESGDLCLRCHAPGAWLEGRSTPTDMSGFIDRDFDGVTCNFCHRLVDPKYRPGLSPAIDWDILAALPNAPTEPHTGEYVMDVWDRRRGPFDLGPDFYIHDWAQSPFHRNAALCGTCHDVSNPAFSKQIDGTYALGPLDERNPGDKYEQFPIERTYSEWKNSTFGVGPVDMGGRFGGNQRLVSACQDCHMPRGSGTACAPSLGGAYRDDLPIHNFNGANSWVLDAVRATYPDSETGLSAASVAAAKARNAEMMALASDMELTQDASSVNVRIINQSGHKLPSGYAEGRRMWINVRFLDAAGALLAEHGGYDPVTATLSAADTKVYEGVMGIGPDVAAATGLPQGPSFHFAINNHWEYDNRIPPMGFTNAAFERAQAAPVGYSYADGQHWDDTQFSIPRGARSVEVNVYHQTTTREYVEFLRDANTTNGAGQNAYNLWVQFGKSAPTLMDTGVLTLRVPGDLNNDGHVDESDLGLLLASWQLGPGGDIDGDGDTDEADLGLLLAYFGS
ncbi:MAG: multiheme c-type cytochrome [Phycisphaerae bacterium]